MGLKANDTTLAKIGENEPIFVLRAQDKWAPLIVRMWALLARINLGPFHNKVLEAEALATKMETWGMRNGAKFPD